MEEIEEIDKEFLGDPFIIQYNISTKFLIVLEFPCLKDLLEHWQIIEDAGYSCKRLKTFNVKFNKADICLDLRNAHTACDFEIEDYL
tara:strand:+ start:145 stop:405 length:261 start_codon:yes stop_codon:yes gene_type:complete